MIDPEWIKDNVSRMANECIDAYLSGFPFVAYAEKRLLPHKRGVYVVVCDDVVVYVGHSWSLKVRFCGHEKEKLFGPLEKVKILYYIVESSGFWEEVLINLCEPTLNKLPDRRRRFALSSRRSRTPPPQPADAQAGGEP